MVKSPPAMQEMWVQPLEEEMTTHSSILAWEIPWTEEPGRLQSTGSQRVGHDRATSLLLSYIYIYKQYYNKFNKDFKNGPHQKNP